MLLALASFGVHARWVYGPPYSYNTSYGSEGGFLSVDSAVNSLIGHYESLCGSTLTCKPHTFSVGYGSATSSTAATITISWINEDGTSGSDRFAYIWATDVTGAGFQPKNVGGCRTMCTGGNGSSLDTLGPRGSSQEGMTKSESSDVGTSMEGDPINAATGNAYRQDTDLHTSPELTFRRFYNSSSYVVASTMGPKWRHTFDRNVQLMPNSGPDAGLLYARRPDGSMVRFHSSGGVWTADSDAAETLLVQKDATTGVTTGYSLKVAASRDVETYDAEGRLLSISDSNGLMTSLEYSDATTDPSIAQKPGLLIAVTDPKGRKLSLRYDSKNRLLRVTDPAAQSVNYEYDSTGNLSRVTFVDGSTRQYVYSEPQYSPAASTYPSELTGVIDEKGVRFETITYDNKNRALSSQYAGGADRIQLEYWNLTQNGGTPVSMITPLGLEVRLGFADDGAEMLKPSGASLLCGNQCNQRWKSVTYDTNGYPASYTDYRNTVTNTTYDARGLLLKQIEASGTDAQRTTSTTWDTELRQPLSRATSNAKGIVVAKSAWAYNTRGQMTAECVIDPAITVSYACGSQAHAPEGIQQTRYTYCDAVDSSQCPQVGLRLTMDGPRTDVTDVTRYSYYLSAEEGDCSAGGAECHRPGDLASVMDPVGHVTSFSSYDQHGRALRHKDSNGVITDVAYTPRGWLASKTVRANVDGSPSSDDAITTLSYEPTGALKTITDADGVKLTFSYDDAHRLIDVSDADGAHIHYTLDASGNRVKEETFDRAGISRRLLARKYNILGQLISVTDGRGHVVFDATASGSYDANGNLVSSKDALGTVQKSGFDALDRLVSHIADANGSGVSTKAATTILALDALGQVKSVTDPDGLVTTYDFDGLSNQVGVASPDAGALTSTFDSAGNALGHVDAKGTVAKQAFDEVGRRVSVSYADSSLNAVFYYDEGRGITGCVTSFPVGRLTRVVEHAITTSYCYDNQGRVTEQRQTQGTVTDTTDYVYTKAGRLAAVASPSALVTQYGHDATGRISTVTVTSANGVGSIIVSAASYLPFGPMASYTLGNGQTISRSYDANYQFTDVVSPTLNLHVARDAGGNVVALGDSPGAAAAIETYTYDALYRLTAFRNASGNIVEAYTYSKTGDRLTKTGPGFATGNYGYAVGTHQLTTVGTASRTYDGNGSTTGNAGAGVTWGYGYDGRGQLKVLQQGGATVATYGYDAAARRVAKTVGSLTTRYTYGPGGLLGEYGAASRDYVWMDDTPVAVVDDAVISFVHADGLDTPRVVTNSAGTVVWNWAYKGNPFGEQAPTSINGYVLNLRFAGQYYDAEAGTVYNGYRYYDPATGRYLQSDPIGLAGGLSTYSYTNANPLSAVDPLGLAEQRYRLEEVVPTAEMVAAEARLTKLATLAAQKVDATCGWRCNLPWIRGTLIHSEFKRLVDSTCPPEKFHTEVTYVNGFVGRYGARGGVRADVVFGPLSNPIVIYDLKTGWAYISLSQGNAYGNNVPPGAIISEIRPAGR